MALDQMTAKQNLALVTMSAAVLVGGWFVLSQPGEVSAQTAVKQAPMFEVDPFWPRPLPNHWVTGSTIGLSVDAQDQVWTIHRPNTVEDNFKAADLTVGDERGRDPEALPGKPGEQVPPGTPIGACCKVAPPVLVYDKAGNLVKSWGGPGKGYDWPDSNHGITVDHQGNVWLADAHVWVVRPDTTLNETFTIGALGNVYESLVKRDKELKLVPALAERWDVLSPLQWRFHLRKGVSFHDGRPFTADDVVFSSDRVRAPTSLLKSRLQPDVKVVKVDGPAIFRPMSNSLWCNSRGCKPGS